MRSVFCGRLFHDVQSLRLPFSKDYLRRVFGPQPFWKWPLLVYRHFFSFGVTLLDRVAVIMGRAKMTGP